jgi:uncharacterized damage-inducible protein DinB
MSTQVSAMLDIVPYWQRLNDGVVRLVDYIPEEQLNWSPRPELWNFRGILLHMCAARHTWMTRDVQDGGITPDLYRSALTKDEIKAHLGASFHRLHAGLLCKPDRLDAEYKDAFGPRTIRGHWLAFHGLEHDIHHRADIFHYLALLEIEHPDVGTP